MADAKYTLAAPDDPDESCKRRVWASFCAAVDTAVLDDLAALPDHDLASVARLGGGEVRRLALRVWHARSVGGAVVA